METLTQELRQFIVHNFLFGEESGQFAFSDDDSLQERGIVDSTGFLELVCHLQEHYAVAIADVGSSVPGSSRVRDVLSATRFSPPDANCFGGKGPARKDNKFALFKKDGDSVASGSTRALGNSVKDACKALVGDWSN